MKSRGAFAFVLAIALTVCGCTTTKDLERRPELVALDAGNSSSDEQAAPAASQPESNDADVGAASKESARGEQKQRRCRGAPESRSGGDRSGCNAGRS